MGFGAPTNRVLTEASGPGTSGQSSIVCTLPSAPAAGNPVIIVFCGADGVHTSFGVSAQDNLGNFYNFSEETGRPTASGILAIGRPLSLAAVKGNVITVSFAAYSAPGLISVEIEEFPVTGGTATFSNTTTTSSAIEPASAPATTITTPTDGSVQAGDLLVEVGLSDHQVTTCDSPFTPVVEGISGGSGTGIFGNSAQGIGYLLSAPSSANIPAAMTQNTSSNWVSGIIAYHFTPAASKVPYQPQYGMAPVMAQ